MLSTPKHAVYRGWRSQGKFLEPDLLTVFQRSPDDPLRTSRLRSLGLFDLVRRAHIPAAGYLDRSRVTGVTW